MADKRLTDRNIWITKRIKIRRKLCGISTERIAFVLEMSEAEYLCLEDAEIAIDQSTFEELALLLSVPIS